MPNSSSFEHFQRSVEARFADFHATLEDLLILIALDDRAKKLDAVKRVLSSLENIKNILSERDRPSWLTRLEERLIWYTGNVGSNRHAGLELLRLLQELNPQIIDQQLKFHEQPGINFAEIYQKHYEASKIPQLFDQLISQLEEVVNSGEIDSVQTIRKLEQLIATV